MNTLNQNIGVALAGGGPEGAIYEIGALYALETAIEGLQFTNVKTLVGVSAGAVIASCLANNVTPAQMIRSIVKPDPGEHPFQPERFLYPALGEYVRAASHMPYFVWEAVKDYWSNPDRTIFKSLTKLSGALPTGLFNNDPIRLFLEKMFSIKARTNDFRELDKQLFVVAADLDRGEAVIFGREHKDVPISVAVQASTALPGAYPPVEINGRHYVDGVLLKTLHTSTVLDTGVDLAICVNPIVPVDTHSSVEAGFMRRGKLIDRGMPSVLSQTFRTLIHSRMKLGFARYDKQYKADLLLFEPSNDDYRMFFTNIFSFSTRRAVCEHAYKSTLRDIQKRRAMLEPILAKHGLKLREEVVEGEAPDLWKSVGLGKRVGKRTAVERLDDAIKTLDEALKKL